MPSNNIEQDEDRFIEDASVRRIAMIQLLMFWIFRELIEYLTAYVFGIRKLKTFRYIFWREAGEKWAFYSELNGQNLRIDTRKKVWKWMTKRFGGLEAVGCVLGDDGWINSDKCDVDELGMKRIEDIHENFVGLISLFFFFSFI